jgi:hypothetical protein
MKVRFDSVKTDPCAFERLNNGDVFSQGSSVQETPTLYMKVGTQNGTDPRGTNAVTLVTGKKVRVYPYQAVVLYGGATVISGLPSVT